MSDTNFYTQSINLLQSLPSELRRTLHLIYDLDARIAQRKHDLLALSDKHIAAIHAKTTMNSNKAVSTTDQPSAATNNNKQPDTTTPSASTPAVASTSAATQQSAHINIHIPAVYTDWIDIEASEAALTLEADEIKKLINKKLQFAQQCYSSVDTYIKKLDNVIRKYENKLRKGNTYDVTAAPVDRRRMVATNTLQQTAETRELMYVLQNMYKSELERFNSQNQQVNNANEPVYCFCKRVSFGHMLGCDSEAECKGGEWFHYSCLGIDVKPRGKWYCDDCKERMKAKEKAANSKDTTVAVPTTPASKKGETAVAAVSSSKKGHDKDNDKSSSKKKQKTGA